MSAQVSRKCQSAYFQLHNIAKIRHCLTLNACKTIVHALVASKLDYGKAGLFVEMGKNFAAHNAAAMPQLPKHHTSPDLATDSTAQ